MTDLLDHQLLWAALLVYVAAGCTAVVSALLGRRPGGEVLAGMAAGLALHTAALALRWERVGHGPFVNLFEILASNIWSLTLAYAIAYWRLPVIRATAAAVMPVLFLLMAWLLVVPAEDGHLPPTYHTLWLYVHVAFGKVFLGAVLVAVGLAGTVLLRRSGAGGVRLQGHLAGLPDDRRLDELAFRFMALGLVFETLMLTAGAIWAQDAWGRYWAWDPLETWAFLTWLALAGSLHARLAFRVQPPAAAAMILTVFALAFFTFFGVPFVSTAPHQGAI